MDNQVFEQLRRLEEKLLLSSVRSSGSEINKMLADDFFEIGSSGITYNKQQAIEALANSSAVQLTLADYKVVLLSPSIALVTYTTANNPGNGGVTSSLRSSIWRLEDGAWKIVFHQGTPC